MAEGGDHFRLDSLGVSRVGGAGGVVGDESGVGGTAEMESLPPESLSGHPESLSAAQCVGGNGDARPNSGRRS